MKKFLLILNFGLLSIFSQAEDPITIIVPGDLTFYQTPMGSFFICEPPYPENICIMISVTGTSAIVTDGINDYEFDKDYIVTEDDRGNPLYIFQYKD